MSSSFFFAVSSGFAMKGHSFEEGLPYAYYVYGRSEKSADELRAWYRANVDQTIWTELDIAAVAEERGETASEDSLFFARREDLTRYVVVELRERPPHELRPGRTMVAIAEVKGVMPQADPHFYHHSGDGHSDAHALPAYQQDAFAQTASPAPSDSDHDGIPDDPDGPAPSAA